jgi:hypothetical protein
MRDPMMTRLREAVRLEISTCFDHRGYAKPRDVARAVCSAYPEQVASLGTRLAEDALTDVARRELKQTTREQGHHLQMLLPGMNEHLRALLPPAISLPAPESEDEEAVIYKPLSQATLADLDAHLELLSSQITADTKRFRALKELRDLARVAGAAAASRVLATLATVPENEMEVA